jgi:catechol 2,3-dioxygenase-like lactoylglutathione lyase family enzyme
MEFMIATLLKDFEEGRLNRRELIRTLAAVAVAGPAAAASTATLGAAAEKSPWKTTKLDHISYSVTDYNKSAEFYAGLMGWEVANDNGTQATMKIGEVGEIIIRNSRRPSEAAGAPAAAAPGGAAERPPITGVINHVSWGVTPWDTDAVKAELERRGLKPRPDMVGDNFKSFHVLDPDGWDLQISNQNE